MIRIGVLSAVLGVGAMACKPPPVDFGESPRTYHAKDYHDVQQRWTRFADLYKGFTSIFWLTGTYKSWDWRQAYIARQRENAALTPAETQALTVRERRAYDEAHEFFLSLAMNVRLWSKLTHPDSAWHLTLVNERGEEVHPLRIERVKRITLEIRENFPYHNPFGEGFLVRFPKTLPDNRPLFSGKPSRIVLRLAGPPGKGELLWESPRRRP